MGFLSYQKDLQHIYLLFTPSKWGDVSLNQGDCFINIFLTIETRFIHEKIDAIKNK